MRNVICVINYLPFSDDVIVIEKDETMFQIVTQRLNNCYKSLIHERHDKFDFINYIDKRKTEKSLNKTDEDTIPALSAWSGEDFDSIISPSEKTASTETDNFIEEQSNPDSNGEEEDADAKLRKVSQQKNKR